jgi:uncharacterized protein (DUF1800 family)
MQWNPQDLLLRLPSNAVIRQIADGKLPLPENRALRVVYENELSRVELRRQEKEQKKQEQAAVQPSTAMSAPTNAAGSESMTSPTMSTSSMEDTSSAKMASGAQSEAQQPAPSTPVATVSAPTRPEPPPVDPALIANVLALAPQQRAVRLAMMKQADFDRFRKALKQPQRAALLAGMNPAQKEYVSALENPQHVVVEELAGQRLTRDIYSSAQLQEVMTDFWLNHFNVYLHKNDETPYYLVSFERDVVRPLALGKFEDLLEATAHSPAMLLYLDNSSSMGPDSPAAERNKIKQARNPSAKKKAPEGLNENYARELMELHTLGVNGGYTQADVTQVARVLTGWTVDRPQHGGGFLFDENRHEPGTKKVLGKKIKEHGELEGRELLHMLASRPATAQFLSRKLAIRFVGDDPPQALVDRMAKAYLASGGDISVVLKTLFHSPEFWAAGDYRAKVKTPIEYIVSAARASNADIENTQPLVNALRDMGMPLYGAVPPTGYNWQSSTWVSTGALVNRMNFALSLAANKFPGIAVNWAPPSDYRITQLSGNAVPAATDPVAPIRIASGPAAVVHTPISGPISGVAADPAAEEQRIEALLVAGGVSESTRTAVLQQLESQNPSPANQVAVVARPINPAQAAASLQKQDQLLAGLLLGSPEFQRR